MTLRPGSVAEPEGLTAALTYASRGWPVAPAHCTKPDGSCSCNDRECGKLTGKHPRTRNGLTDATTDEKQIREWWGKWPDANVLIRTGKVGERYLVVLDVDQRNDGEENLARLLNENTMLPETPMVVTGGGGQHVFMWSRLPVKSSANQIAPGIDVRGVGGYVIAPPSTHVSGRRYEWDVGAHPAETPLAEAPAWFVARAGLAGERVKVKQSDIAGAEISEIFEGGRNNAMTKIAGAMRRPGVGERAILAALRIVNDERCKPPLDDWELEKIARSIGRLEPGDPVQGDASDPLPTISWVEVFKPLPPVQWIVKDLAIAPGAVTIIGGAGGGGKTMAMQAMLTAIASGRKVWGHFEVAQGRVVHIDCEQGPHITRERYQRMANSMGVPSVAFPANSLALCELPKAKFKADKATEDTLVRVCEGARVAVIDAFRGFFQEAKENDSDARKYLDMLQAVSERTKCAMLPIMHSRKVTEDADPRSSLRGSSALFDAAQTVYMFDGTDGKPSKVHNTKDRFGSNGGRLRSTFGIQVRDEASPSDPKWGLSVLYLSPEEVQAEYMQNADDEQLEFAANIERIATASMRVVALMSQARDGLSAKDISNMTGVSEKLLHTVLGGLIQENAVRDEGHGTNRRFFPNDF